MFSGRLLKCKNCGFTFKSSMNFESMWTTVIVDGVLIDFCPKCFGVPRRHWPIQVVDAYDEFIASGSHPDKKTGQ